MAIIRGGRDVTQEIMERAEALRREIGVSPTVEDDAGYVLIRIEALLAEHR